MIVKEVKKGDVSPVAMFGKVVIPGCQKLRFQVQQVPQVLQVQGTRYIRYQTYLKKCMYRCDIIFWLVSC